ncbi:MAG: sigma-70 family RNA polymerase sigma factor [Acidobacteriales bacterium]|nr:sigma-70 family RNA polymerase sigma factor [Terriglobales bacterium]
MLESLQAVTERAMSSSGSSMGARNKLSSGFGADDAERALLQRACEGDKQSFCLLVQPYEAVLYVTATALTSTDGDAEDLAQQAVLTAFLKLPEFNCDNAFRTWLIEITIGEARHRAKGDSVSVVDQTRHAETEYLPENAAPWLNIPIEALEGERFRDMLRSALRSLPANYREVFVLRDVHKLGVAETARILSLSEPEVRSRLSGARLRMRDALAYKYVNGSGGNTLERRVS